MTFTEAVKALSEGGDVYRPHWDAGTRLSLAVDGWKGVSVIALMERGKAPVHWSPELGDLLADDWETETYVLLNLSSSSKTSQRRRICRIFYRLC